MHLDLWKPRNRQRTAPCRSRHFEYLDEDISHARLSVAGISLTRHDSNGLAVHLVMVQILQPFHSCTKHDDENRAKWLSRTVYDCMESHRP